MHSPEKGVKQIMAKNTKGAKINIPMGIACALFCLTLVSFYLCGGLYARYATAGSGENGSRVARWRVLAAGDKQQITVDCCTTTMEGVYAFQVESQSDVAVSYDVAVVFEQPLTEGITLQLDEGILPAEDGSRNRFVFEDAGSFPPGGQIAAHTLTFSADTEKIPEDISCPFHLEIVFEQID